MVVTFIIAANEMHMCQQNIVQAQVQRGRGTEGKNRMDFLAKAKFICEND